MRVIYFEHSGFCVEGAHHNLIFDYIKGDISRLDSDKPTYIFVSHAHGDHYNQDIFKLFKDFKPIYIMSDDCHTIQKGVHFMGANQTLLWDDIEILTLKSTDEGVGFLVKFEQHCIFHAGDLNDWNWLDESSDEENNEMRLAYQHEIDKLKDEQIDIAFVVLDPRLKQAASYGLQYFMKHCHVDYIVPMHCWEHYEFIKQVKEALDPLNKMIEIKHHNQVFIINETGIHFQESIIKREKE
ncbi:MAG: MBL fold metallo-hydrolase [Erysipelotrichaceae bacterium]